MKRLLKLWGMCSPIIVIASIAGYLLGGTDGLGLALLTGSALIGIFTVGVLVDEGIL